MIPIDADRKNDYLIYFCVEWLVTENNRHQNAYYLNQFAFIRYFFSWL